MAGSNAAVEIYKPTDGALSTYFYGDVKADVNESAGWELYGNWEKVGTEAHWTLQRKKAYPPKSTLMAWYSSLKTLNPALASDIYKLKIGKTLPTPNITKALDMIVDAMNIVFTNAGNNTAKAQAEAGKKAGSEYLARVAEAARGVAEAKAQAAADAAKGAAQLAAQVKAVNNYPTAFNTRLMATSKPPAITFSEPTAPPETLPAFEQVFYLKTNKPTIVSITDFEPMYTSSGTNTTHGDYVSQLVQKNSLDEQMFQRIIDGLRQRYTTMDQAIKDSTSKRSYTLLLASNQASKVTDYLNFLDVRTKLLDLRTQQFSPPGGGAPWGLLTNYCGYRLNNTSVASWSSTKIWVHLMFEAKRALRFYTRSFISAGSMPLTNESFTVEKEAMHDFTPTTPLFDYDLLRATVDTPQVFQNLNQKNVADGTFADNVVNTFQRLYTHNHEKARTEYIVHLLSRTLRYSVLFKKMVTTSKPIPGSPNAANGVIAGQYAASIPGKLTLPFNYSATTPAGYRDIGSSNVDYFDVAFGVLPSTTYTDAFVTDVSAERTLMSLAVTPSNVLTFETKPVTVTVLSKQSTYQQKQYIPGSEYYIDSMADPRTGQNKLKPLVDKFKLLDIALSDVAENFVEPNLNTAMGSTNKFYDSLTLYYDIIVSLGLVSPLSNIAAVNSQGKIPTTSFKNIDVDTTSTNAPPFLDIIPIISFVSQRNLRSLMAAQPQSFSRANYVKAYLFTIVMCNVMKDDSTAGAALNGSASFAIEAAADNLISHLSQAVPRQPPVEAQYRGKTTVVIPRNTFRDQLIRPTSYSWLTKMINVMKAYYSVLKDNVCTSVTPNPNSPYQYPSQTYFGGIPVVAVLMSVFDIMIETYSNACWVSIKSYYESTSRNRQPKPNNGFDVYIPGGTDQYRFDDINSVFTSLKAEQTNVREFIKSVSGLTHKMMTFFSDVYSSTTRDVVDGTPFGLDALANAAPEFAELKRNHQQMMLSFHVLKSMRHQLDELNNTFCDSTRQSAVAINTMTQLYFKRQNYVLGDTANKRIITVGIPQGFIKSLRNDSDVISRSAKFTTWDVRSSNNITVSINKTDESHIGLVFKPITRRYNVAVTPDFSRSIDSTVKGVKFITDEMLVHNAFQLYVTDLTTGASVLADSSNVPDMMALYESIFATQYIRLMTGFDLSVTGITATPSKFPQWDPDAYDAFFDHLVLYVTQNANADPTTVDVGVPTVSSQKPNGFDSSAVAKELSTYQTAVLGNFYSLIGDFTSSPCTLSKGTHLLDNVLARRVFDNVFHAIIDDNDFVVDIAQTNGTTTGTNMLSYLSDRGFIVGDHLRPGTSDSRFVKYAVTVEVGDK